MKLHFFPEVLFGVNRPSSVVLRVSRVVPHFSKTSGVQLLFVTVSLNLDYGLLNLSIEANVKGLYTSSEFLWMTRADLTKVDSEKVKFRLIVGLLATLVFFLGEN